MTPTPPPQSPDTARIAPYGDATGQNDQTCPETADGKYPSVTYGRTVTITLDEEGAHQEAQLARALHLNADGPRFERVTLDTWSTPVTATQGDKP